MAIEGKGNNAKKNKIILIMTNFRNIKVIKIIHPPSEALTFVLKSQLNSPLKNVLSLKKLQKIQERKKIKMLNCKVKKLSK